MRMKMTVSRPASRRAFSLVELLVVVAIIGILIGLLMPAVQTARESARTAACRNNLRQFGLAMHSYETGRRQLPTGYRFVPHPQGNASGFSWGAFLLPFIEEDAVYKAVRFDLPIHDPANLKPREQHLPVFLCPADAVSANGFVAMGDERYAMACYVGNFGPPDLDETQEKRAGVFSRNSRTRLKEITDGLSKTYMLGERQNGPFRQAAVHGNHFQYETIWAGAVRDIDDPTDDHGHMVLFQSGHPPNHAQSDDRDVSSSHPGFAQFLICDGSVRAVDESIDAGLHVAWSTRAGGEAVAD
jgi:prepilin-type N-terminal cleavage/methylation domain-containing protein